ncbi:hypothetical protein IMZ48_08080 [Candidatus Bathyarchaeota archaeon]|nr:hypothetical protein [Candidatus Bathyarchaeota archaeon]
MVEEGLARPREELSLAAEAVLEWQMHDTLSALQRRSGKNTSGGWKGGPPPSLCDTRVCMIIRGVVITFFPVPRSAISNAEFVGLSTLLASLAGSARGD